MGESKLTKKGYAFFQTCLQTAIVSLIIVLILTFFIFVTLLLEFFGIDIPIEKDNLYFVLTIVATIGGAFYIFNSTISKNEKEKILRQKDLLRVLLVELNFLKDNFEAYQETFSKNEEHNKYPLFELWDMDVSVYLRNLNHRIEEKETINLKKNLMEIKDKLLLINNFKNQAYKLEEEKETKPLIKKIGVIDMIRNKIVKVIQDEILPLIKQSKLLIKEKWSIDSAS